MTDPDSTWQLAADTARGLRAGSWESVHTLALLVVTNPQHPTCPALLADAQRAAASLKPGSWESARALTLLSLAERSVPLS